MDTRNVGMLKYDPYATADEIGDLAPPLSITEVANLARKFIRELPDDLIDVDLGNGL